jgi:uncharacterized membrane protein HdeD (DUF308 family)
MNDMDLSKSAVALDSKAEKDLWWMFLLRGIFMVLFGMLAVTWPGITIALVAWFFSIFLLVVGVVDIVSSIRSIANHRSWFLRGLLGLFEVGVALYLLDSGAAVKVATLTIFIGLTFILQGIVEMVGAFTNHRDAGYTLLTFLVGVISFVAGVVMVRYPVESGVAFAWVLGLYGIVAGALVIALSFTVRTSGVEGRPAKQVSKKKK